MSIPRAVFPLSVAVISLFAVGCQQEKTNESLAGFWEGAAVCGDAGGVSVVFDVEDGEEQYTFDAVGLVTGLSNPATDVEMTALWSLDKSKGPQVIDVDATCVAVREDGEFDMSCEGFDELGWDGADTLEATVSNFVGSGYDCDLTLIRQ